MGSSRQIHRIVLFFIFCMFIVGPAACSRSLDVVDVLPPGRGPWGIQTPAATTYPNPVNSFPPDYPTPTPNPNDESQEEFPYLKRDGSKLSGKGLVNGLLIGISNRFGLTDRRVSKQVLHDTVCLLKKQYGLNLFKTTATFRAETKMYDPQIYVSVFKNKNEWLERRDTLLDAGIECGVYIAITLFDLASQNDEAGYPREVNSWNGREPSLDLAKELTENYYLSGIEPTAPRGRVLIVDRLNEPSLDEFSETDDRAFDQFLSEKGFFTLGYPRDGGVFVPGDFGGFGMRYEYYATNPGYVTAKINQISSELQRIPLGEYLATEPKRIISPGAPYEAWADVVNEAFQKKFNLIFNLGKSSVFALVDPELELGSPVPGSMVDQFLQDVKGGLPAGK